MKRYSGRGPALSAALLHLTRRPVRLLLVTSLLAILLAVAELAAVAAWRAPSTALGQPRPVVSVLMPVGAGAPEAAHVREVLQRNPLVAGVRFLPREASLAELARRPALSALSTGESRGNPLPDAWVVTLVPTATPEQVGAAVGEWSRDSWVGSVEYDPQVWQRWTALRQLAHWLLGVLALALSASFLLALGACVQAGPAPDAAQRRVLMTLGAAPAVLRRPSLYGAAAQALLAGVLGGLVAMLGGARLAQLADQYAEAFGLVSPVAAPPAWFALCAALALCLLVTLAAALQARWQERAR